MKAPLLYPVKINGNRHHGKRERYDNGKGCAAEADQRKVPAMSQSQGMESTPEAMQQMPEQGGTAKQVDEHLNRVIEFFQHHSIKRQLFAMHKLVDPVGDPEIGSMDYQEQQQ